MLSRSSFTKSMRRLPTYTATSGLSMTTSLGMCQPSAHTTSAVAEGSPVLEHMGAVLADSIHCMQ